MLVCFQELACVSTAPQTWSGRMWRTWSLVKRTAVTRSAQGFWRYGGGLSPALLRVRVVKNQVSVQSYGSEGLQLVEHQETVLSGQAVLQLTFDPGVFGHTPITARCQLDHPFYVKNKGTSEAADVTLIKGNRSNASPSFCQGGRHFTPAWLWCIMGYRAMKLKWEMCACLLDTETLSTQMIHSSLTPSEGEVFLY